MAAVLSLAKDKQAITSPPSSKRTATFFLETVPKESKCFYKSHLAAHEVKATTQCYSCGYMKKGDSIAEEIPEVPFCNGKKSSPKQLVIPYIKQCDVSYFHEIQPSPSSASRRFNAETETLEKKRGKVYLQKCQSNFSTEHRDQTLRKPFFFLTINPRGAPPQAYAPAPVL